MGMHTGTFYPGASGEPYTSSYGEDMFQTASLVQIYDANAQNDYRVNSPAGEYAVLYMKDYFAGSGAVSGNLANPVPSKGLACGLLYYQAGIAVLTASLFDQVRYGDSVKAHRGFLSRSADVIQGVGPLGRRATAGFRFLTGSTIDQISNGFRHRIFNLQFNNTTELNSTVYFCRLAHNEFNYSSNLTYLSSSKLRVKQNSSDPPVAYVTTVGLYSVDNELLATAKVSEPLKKDPTNELTLRVRLDY
jgi:hypothetical protein